MGRGPTGAEKLGEDGVLRLDQPLAVSRMRAALLREQEAGAGHGGARSGRERLAHVALLGDSAGEQQRVVGRQRLLDPVEQLQRRHRPAHVTARLHALDDHRVGARRMGRAGLGNRTALVHPDAGNTPSRLAPEGDDHVCLGRCREPVAPGKGQQEVDGNRPVGQRPRRRQLAPDRPRAVDGDRPQPTGLGHRRRQLMATEPATHPGLDDRRFDPDALKQRHTCSLSSRKVQVNRKMLSAATERCTVMLVKPVSKTCTARESPPPNEGLVDWLLACPLKGYFVAIDSESTDTP
jgi:hypothetical protein